MSSATFAPTHGSKDGGKQGKWTKKTSKIMYHLRWLRSSTIFIVPFKYLDNSVGKYGKISPKYIVYILDEKKNIKRCFSFGEFTNKHMRHD